MVGESGPWRDAFLRRADELREDPRQGLPEDLVLDRRFIFAGDRLVDDIAALMEVVHAEGIVARKPPEKPSRLHLDSAAWIKRARQNPGIVTVNLGATAQEYAFFEKRARAAGIPIINLIEILRWLELEKKAETIRRRFTLGLVFLLPFFKETLRAAERFARVADSFDDALSRKTAWLMLSYRLKGDPRLLNRASVGMNTSRFGARSYEVNARFFRFGEKEIFVDGGGYVGESVEQFHRAVKGRFKHIYCFEPSPKSRSLLRKRLVRIRGWQPDRFTLFPEGLWSKAGTARFDVSGFLRGRSSMASPSAYVVESGVLSHILQESGPLIQTPLTTIDRSAPDATFIKLEVEGSEAEAIRGAAGTILRNRPQMCVGLYHKPEDWLIIPDLIRNQNPRYKFHLRQHNCVIPDSTMLYVSET